MLERTFHTQDADHAAVIGDQDSIIHGLKATVGMHRPGKGFRKGTNTPVNAVDK